MVNNHILKNLHFPFPLILSALGLVTTSCVCFFTLRIAPRMRRALESATGRCWTLSSS